MTDPPDDGEQSLTLHQLIRARMSEHGWSYADLERRSDHALSRGRWQQLGSGVQQKKFPDPASLVIIARVLDTDITTIVLAAAQAVGLNVAPRDSTLATMLPAGTDRLPERMRDAILTLIRASLAGGTAEDGATNLDSLDGLTLEWPKAAAPSRQPPERTIARGK